MLAPTCFHLQPVVTFIHEFSQPCVHCSQFPAVSPLAKMNSKNSCCLGPGGGGAVLDGFETRVIPRFPGRDRTTTSTREPNTRPLGRRQGGRPSRSLCSVRQQPGPLRGVAHPPPARRHRPRLVSELLAVSKEFISNLLETGVKLRFSKSRYTKSNQPPETKKHSVCNPKDTKACGYQYKN